jgi:hypothetical protein
MGLCKIKRFLEREYKIKKDNIWRGIIKKIGEDLKIKQTLRIIRR